MAIAGMSECVHRKLLLKIFPVIWQNKATELDNLFSVAGTMISIYIQNGIINLKFVQNCDWPCVVSTNTYTRCCQLFYLIDDSERSSRFGIIHFLIFFRFKFLPIIGLTCIISRIISIRFDHTSILHSTGPRSHRRSLVIPTQNF